MTHVITRDCSGICDTACVSVCPVDCIIGPVPVSELRRYDQAERTRRFPGVQLFIDADECTDCGACVPECPEDAIHDLPEDSENALHNAAFFRPPV